MYKSLYMHIPFCKSRCTYCDFATIKCNDDALLDAYMDALSLQLRRASRAGDLAEIETIYIGGGTPTHVGTRRLSSLIYLISLSVNLENVHEFTLEANPESITERMVKDLYALGVNRISLGAQSFDNAILRFYKRAHSASEIKKAVAAVTTRIENYSLDLICGGPLQSMESWKTSLHEALALNVKHLSIYPLMIEDKTPLAAMIQQGECTPPDDELQADMMIAAEEILTEAGMHRYETASYAYDGFEAKHNSAYWTGKPYIGLGVAASSMQQDCSGQRVRRTSHSDVQAFIDSAGHPHFDEECLTGTQALFEDIMLGLRMSRGVSQELIDKGVSHIPALKETIETLKTRGLLQQCDDRVVPTQRGWLCGNEIFASVWNLTLD